MKNLFSILIATLCIAPAAFADSGNTSLSCQGTLNGQDYYIYWSQFVYVQNNVIQNENHSFNVDGFLLGEVFTPDQQVSGPFVIYQSAHYFLAVPWKSNSYGIWLQSKKSQPDTWTKICPL